MYDPITQLFWGVTKVWLFCVASHIPGNQIKASTDLRFGDGHFYLVCLVTILYWYTFFLPMMHRARDVYSFWMVNIFIESRELYTYVIYKTLSLPFLFLGLVLYCHCYITWMGTSSDSEWTSPTYVICIILLLYIIYLCRVVRVVCRCRVEAGENDQIHINHCKG